MNIPKGEGEFCLYWKTRKNFKVTQKVVKNWEDFDIKGYGEGIYWLARIYIIACFLFILYLAP